MSDSCGERSRIHLSPGNSKGTRVRSPWTGHALLRSIEFACARLLLRSNGRDAARRTILHPPRSIRNIHTHAGHEACSGNSGKQKIVANVYARRLNPLPTWNLSDVTRDTRTHVIGWPSGHVTILEDAARETRMTASGFCVLNCPLRF